MRSSIRLTLLATGALALAACTPTTADNQRTQTGAAVGAMAGGLLGAATGGSSTGDRLLRTAVGAGIGAAVGGAIGATLDQQARELRQELGNDVDIRNTGSELVVTMPNSILFDFDSAAVRSDLQGDLRALAAHLRAYPDSTIQVIGHTDNTGAASYNQNLSERRAAAVAAVLRNAGVPGSRIRAIGLGEDHPVASNLTSEGRAQNRRVEIIITPTG